MRHFNINYNNRLPKTTRVHLTRRLISMAGRFKVFPIYHPAAAIYDRTKMEALENDFATLGQLLRE